MAAEKKRVFGGFEAAFDVLYLALGLGLGAYMLLTSSGGARTLAGISSHHTRWPTFSDSFCASGDPE